MVREWISLIFIIAGTLVFGIGVLGTIRFTYVMNRMHAAALGDTLGALLIISGLMIMGIDIYHGLKLVLVVVFLWLTSPVSSNFIARIERMTNLHFTERVNGKK